ncbi:MAG: SAM-dependent methyltransferase, partial [Microthrixaceae bacterium]
LAARGPRFLSHNEMDQVGGPVDLVFANELLDNIPTRILQRTEDGWSELHVGVDPSEPGMLCEVLVPLDPTPMPADVEPDPEAGTPGTGTSGARIPGTRNLIDWADSVAAGASVGARIPVQQQASDWLVRALRLVRVPGGELIVIDYCRNTGELAQLDWTAWLRTYREQQRGGPPLSQPGSQDITCDVALDQLAHFAPTRVAEPRFNVPQAEWLADLGIGELVEEGRRIWNESAAAPDLAAIRARSRISEAQALTDGSGLGGFRVLAWKL